MLPGRCLQEQPWSYPPFPKVFRELQTTEGGVQHPFTQGAFLTVQPPQPAPLCLPGCDRPSPPRATIRSSRPSFGPPDLPGLRCWDTVPRLLHSLTYWRVGGGVCVPAGRQPGTPWRSLGHRPASTRGLRQHQRGEGCHRSCPHRASAGSCWSWFRK